MSPVEKPVVIPLEYHRIDTEFSQQSSTTTNTTIVYNHNHNENDNDLIRRKNNKNFHDVIIVNTKNLNKNQNQNQNGCTNAVCKPNKISINQNGDKNNNNDDGHADEKNISVNNHNGGSTNNSNDRNNYPKCNRNRQIFGIQLEVTSLLLEAERRKLSVLQRELQIALEDSGSIKKAKEHFKQELILAISRIQSQYDLLENEYKQHAIGRLRNSKNRGTGKSNRSQPAIGLKQTPKARPTIFGTVASDQSPKDNANKRALPQTTTTSSGCSIASVQRKSNDKQTSSSSSLVPTSSSEIAGNECDNGIEKENVLVATEENSLVYRDGNLISGPLDALIQHMVPTSDYYPDRSYIFAFLLSARLFIRPYKLLEKICQLCKEQQRLNCILDKVVKYATNDKCNLDFENSFNINNKSNNSSSNSTSNNSSSGSGLNDNNCDHRHCYRHNKDEKNNETGGDDEECCKKLKKFAQHFVRLLAEWIDTFPYDFRDERIMQHVRLWTKTCTFINQDLRKDINIMLQNLLQRLTILEGYEKFLISISNDPNEFSTTNSILLPPSGTGSVIMSNENRILTGGGGGGGITSSSSSAANQQHQNSSSSSHHQQSGTYHQNTGGTLGGLLHTNSSSSSNCLHSSNSNNSILSSIDIIELCPNPTLLAHQLTHIELERLSHIGPEEFVQAFAKENPHLEQSFNDIKKTRNLESYIQWFNRLSYFVATEIVKHCKKKQRVRIVEYWIETARECFNIGNFNSLMAIIAGLNMSPISRLKKTWAKVQTAKFSVLEHQMDPSSNFHSYRSTLKAAMWRSAGATDERERIVIPFFSLLVKDLYFLNEGCSNKLENGHVNFEKFWQLAKQVTEFIAWKQVTCPFEKLPKVITFLYTNPILNENMLALASFECEPPENHEKDRYKCLKYEQQQQQQHQQQQQQYNQQQQ